MCLEQCLAVGASQKLLYSRLFFTDAVIHSLHPVQCTFVTSLTVCEEEQDPLLRYSVFTHLRESTAC